MRPKLTYANVVATIALFIAIGGASAFAASQFGKNSVGAKQLKKNAVKTGKIAPGAVKAGKIAKSAVVTNRLKDDAVTGAKVNESSLSTVPSAQLANSLLPPEQWHVVGSPGEPPFEGTWRNVGYSGTPLYTAEIIPSRSSRTAQAWFISRAT